MTSRAVVRTDFSRGEAVGGLVWLSIGALFSLFVEMLYLGTWVTVPGVGEVPLPWTILLAAVFNAVLTRTAMLWSDKTWVHVIPLAVWVAGCFAALALADAWGIQLLANNFRTIMLFIAGIAGGVWPVFRSK